MFEEIKKIGIVPVCVLDDAKDAAALGELFAMTPFCRRVGDAARDRIAASGGSPMTVSVDAAVFRKS